MHDKIRTESQLVRFTALLQEKIKHAASSLLSDGRTDDDGIMAVFHIKKINTWNNFEKWPSIQKKKKKKSVLFFSLTWKVDMCSSEGLFCPMKVQCLCEMLICASFGLIKRKKKKTPTRLVWRTAADVSRHVRAWRKNDVWGGSAVDRNVQKRIRATCEFPSTQVWDSPQQSQKGKKKSARETEKTFIV